MGISSRGLDGAAADAIDAMFRNAEAAPEPATVIELGDGA
jgi:hypothetical protein